MSIFVKEDDFISTEINKAKKLECCKCKLISHKNYCIQCGHCICEQCIINNNKCLIDNKEIIKQENAFQFPFLYYMLKDLKIKCPFNCNGCLWIDNYEKYIRHHFNECKYKEIKNHFLQLNDCKTENNLTESDQNINESLTKSCLNFSDSSFKEEKMTNDLNSDNSYEFNTIKNSHEIYDYSISNSEINIKENHNSKSENETENENFKYLNDDDIPIIPFKNGIHEENLTSTIMELKEFERIIVQNNNASKYHTFKYIYPQELYLGFECQITIKGKSGKNISIGTFSDNIKKYQELFSVKEDPEFFELGNKIKIVYTKNNFLIKDENYKKSITRCLYEKAKHFLCIILKNKNDVIELNF